MKIEGFSKLGFLLIVPILCLSCGGSNGTSSGNVTEKIRFADYEDIIKDIAPDIFDINVSSSVQRSPGAIDPLWYEGDDAILEKVLGAESSQSIFYFLDQFQGTVSNIEDLLEVDDSGNLFADTTWMRLYDLTSATVIPSEARSVIGNSVYVEHWIDVEFESEPEGKINHIGFTKNDDEETILLYNYWPAGEYSDGSSSWIFYAHFDLDDSSVTMKGVTYKDMGDGHTTCEAFDIHSVDESDFAYRLSWYSDEITDPEPTTLLGCIAGGGNRDTEFALRYRQFMPADSEEFDQNFLLDQVFNSDYSEGASLISAYNEYIDENLIFRLDDIPTQNLPSPWE